MSEPEDIETTTMDNLKFKTAIQGLQDVQKYTFEFNWQKYQTDWYKRNFMQKELRENGEPLNK